MNFWGKNGSTDFPNSSSWVTIQSVEVIGSGHFNTSCLFYSILLPQDIDCDPIVMEKISFYYCHSVGIDRRAKSKSHRRQQPPIRGEVKRKEKNHIKRALYLLIRRRLPSRMLGLKDKRVRHANCDKSAVVVLSCALVKEKKSCLSLNQ